MTKRHYNSYRSTVAYAASHEDAVMAAKTPRYTVTAAVGPDRATYTSRHYTLAAAGRAIWDLKGSGLVQGTLRMVDDAGVYDIYAAKWAAADE